VRRICGASSRLRRCVAANGAQADDAQVADGQPVRGLAPDAPPEGVSEVLRRLDLRDF
jgi:hypothetical protein